MLLQLRPDARRTLLVLVAALSATACRSGSPTDPHALPPEPPREFRAAWVATVSNIDWPSRHGLPADEQRAEAIAILDRLAELHFNAVIFQVRPHCDALYASELEPWSAYLSGTEGEPPSPAYDPLAFWVEEAHRRGMQLHAWFNPYRAAHPSRPGPPAADSVINERPELVVQLGEGAYRWLDPAKPEVRALTTAVVLDVVDRYDVDGVHFDDYFYPYASYSGGADFPDGETYAAYLADGGELDRADFRRAAVDTLIEALHGELEERGVLFGISPFGIWRPGHPEGIQGLDAHDALYADARRWLVEGWVDYMMPQLYWPIAKLEQSFPVLLGWWTRQNPMGRHVWPGTSIARMRGEGGATELVGQVLVNRGLVPEDPGFCVFSAKHLMPPDSPLGKALLEGPFARPALPPRSPWIEGEKAARPRLRIVDGGLEIESAGAAPLAWLIQVQREDAWTWTILPGTATSHRWEQSPPDAVRVRGFDRRGTLGEAADARPLAHEQL